jgi:hypothetical protein
VLPAIFVLALQHNSCFFSVVLFSPHFRAPDRTPPPFQSQRPPGPVTFTP